jgi:hypothetical protein
MGQPEWRTPLSRAMALAMIEAGDYADLPILADLLTDCGAPAPLVDYCRAADTLIKQRAACARAFSAFGEDSYQYMARKAADSGGTCLNYGDGGAEDDWREYTAEDLIAAADCYLDTGDCLTQMGTERLRSGFYYGAWDDDAYDAEKVRARLAEFWGHFTALTGRPAELTEEGREYAEPYEGTPGNPFSCSC